MENRLEAITRNEAAYLLGVTPSQISRLKGQGLPVNADGRTHDARQLVLYDQERSEAAAGCAENSATLKVLTKWRGEKYKIARLDRLERERRVVLWSAVESQWVERVVLVCSGLETLPDRLSALVAGKTRREAHEVIKGEVKLLRQGFARDGQYCPAPFDTEAFADAIREVVSRFSKGAEDGGGNRQTG